MVIRPIEFVVGEPQRSVGAGRDSHWPVDAAAGVASNRSSFLSFAVLVDATLTNGNLFGSNADYANLTGANLTGANLTLVTLTGANLTGADLTGVTWSNTTCPDGSNSDSHGDTCIGYGI